jgi:hypothetical protein
MNRSAYKALCISESEAKEQHTSGRPDSTESEHVEDRYSGRGRVEYNDAVDDMRGRLVWMFGHPI